MRRHDHPARKPWHPTKRVALWVYRFFFGPFLTKLKDGTIMGSMTRWLAFGFGCAEVYRLTRLPIGQATWAEAFLAFFILFALPIDGALNTAPAEKVLDLLGSMAGKGAEAASSVWSRTSETVAPAFTAPQPLTEADLMAPVAHGRPEPEPGDES